MKSGESQWGEVGGGEVKKKKKKKSQGGECAWMDGWMDGEGQEESVSQVEKNVCRVRESQGGGSLGGRAVKEA
ncbi:hypothetical protein Pmani_038308 [Petrolisthes manimaculis]|uniref:Uncharacterized protein n=1 Tax=Petrolisthes manimaculis TaxID=1843537 RepID=A0AAE1NG04_9EUCA|nr:hypothetical protein Pmani_038308 [Petrolisthes manimaculis]